MVRLPLAMALLSAGFAGAQPKPMKYELPPTEFPNIVVKGKSPNYPDVDLNTDQGKKALAEYTTQRREYEKQFEPPLLPKVLDTDKPLVRAAKSKMQAVLRAHRTFRGRVEGGIYANSEFFTYCELSVSLTAAADLAIPAPADRLKWYEYRVLMMKASELYCLAKFGRVIDLPYSLLQASAARLDAEIALLKLKEQIGK